MPGENSSGTASSTDTSEALRLAGLPESKGRQAAIAAFVAGLTDPTACAALATNLPTFGHALAGAALQRWVELDPTGAIRDFALPTRERDLRLSHLDWMFRDFATRDPMGAYQQALSFPGLSEVERQTGIAATLTELARVDAPTAVNALRALPTSVATGPAAEIYADLARNGQPASLFVEAGELRGTARAVAQQSVLRTAASTDPQAAVALWHGIENAGLRHDLTRSLAEGFLEAGVKPADLAGWLFENAPERGAESVRAEALQRLAADDPARASALLNQLPPGEQNELRLALANTLDPAEALQFARGITRVDQREAAYSDLASRFGASDPSGFAAEFAKDPEFARAALPAMVDTLAYEDIGAATRYVQQIPDEHRREAVLHLLDRVSDLSPERAVALAATLLPEGDARHQAMASAYAATIADRPVSNTGNLPQVPSGTDPDQLYAATVPLIAFRNPESAWHLSQAIQDENLRLNAVQEVIRGYASADSLAAAEQRLAQANLPPDVAQEIRAYLGRKD